MEAGEGLTERERERERAHYICEEWSTRPVLYNIMLLIYIITFNFFFFLFISPSQERHRKYTLLSGPDKATLVLVSIVRSPKGTRSWATT